MTRAIERQNVADRVHASSHQTASQHIETGTVMWIELANQYLHRKYGVTIEDVGYTEAELIARWQDQGRTPEDAVEAFAERYDLRCMESW